MKNNKIYEVANPALKLKMIRVELTDDVIRYSVSDDGIQQRNVEEYLYTDITQVNISLVDINRNQITIEFKSGKKLKLISLTLGKLKDGKIVRETVNQTDEFNSWISELHKILIAKKLVTGIDFSEGSNGKILILILVTLVCFIGILFAIAIEKIGVACTLLSGGIFCGILIFKMGTKKKYDPANKLLG